MKKITSELFRQSMSKYATGVTIITINQNSKYTGKTVNSLDPPLVLFSIDKKSSSLNEFKKSPFLGINVLSKKQKSLSNHFSSRQPIWGKTPYILSKNNVPLIKNCVINFDCKITKLIKQGDHIIFICNIRSLKIDQTKKSLVYLNSKYY